MQGRRVVCPYPVPEAGCPILSQPHRERVGNLSPNPAAFGLPPTPIPRLLSGADRPKAAGPTAVGRTTTVAVILTRSGRICSCFSGVRSTRRNPLISSLCGGRTGRSWQTAHPPRRCSIYRSHKSWAPILRFFSAKGRRPRTSLSLNRASNLNERRKASPPPSATRSRAVPPSFSAALSSPSPSAPFSPASHQPAAQPPSTRFSPCVWSKFARIRTLAPCTRRVNRAADILRDSRVGDSPKDWRHKRPDSGLGVHTCGV